MQTPAQQQLDVLQAQRSALSKQLLSETIQRDYLNQQLAHATGQAATDLHAQIDEVAASVKATTDALRRVDDATNRAVTSGLPATTEKSAVEAQIDAAVNRAVASRLPATTGTSSADAQVDRLQRLVVSAGGIGGIAIMAVVVLVLSRTRSWSRGRPAPQQLSGEDSMRLDQLQRAVDVIAVEVERISESQRYMAKSAAEEKRVGG